MQKKNWDFRIRNATYSNLFYLYFSFNLGKGKITKETWIEECHKAKKRLNTQQ